MRCSLKVQAFLPETPRGLLTNVHEHGNYVIVNGLSLRHKANISWDKIDTNVSKEACVSILFIKLFRNIRGPLLSTFSEPHFLF